MKVTLWITQWEAEQWRDSEQTDKHLLCLISGALWVWATWPYEAHLPALLHFCCILNYRSSESKCNQLVIPAAFLLIWACCDSMWEVDFGHRAQTIQNCWRADPGLLIGICQRHSALAPNRGVSEFWLPSLQFKPWNKSILLGRVGAVFANFGLFKLSCSTRQLLAPFSLSFCSFWCGVHFVWGRICPNLGGTRILLGLPPSPPQVWEWVVSVQTTEPTA